MIEQAAERVIVEAGEALHAFVEQRRATFGSFIAGVAQALRDALGVFGFDDDLVARQHAGIGQLLQRALRAGIEAAQRGDGVAVELDAQRVVPAHRPDIQDAATARAVTHRLDFGIAFVAQEHQSFEQLLRLEVLARAHAEQRARHLGGLRDFLEHAAHGGHDHA